MITERYVQVGARVGPSSKLYDLIKLDDLIARVFAPGQYLTTVGSGQQALITSDFLPDKQFHGWVKRISPVVDPRSGTFKVTVGLHDRWQYLRPGLFVNVRIVTATHTRRRVNTQASDRVRRRRPVRVRRQGHHGRADQVAARV